MSVEERFANVGGGTRLCYQRFGDESAPAILLVAGLGQQLGAWPLGFVERLTSEGFQVIRFDNRDVGRSSQGRAPAPNPVRFVTRRWHPSQYSLDDMALDTSGLVGELDLGQVHVVGMSMGGMIGQMLAARHGEQVASLTSIMSMTGARGVGRPHVTTWLRMAGPPSTTREKAADSLVAMMRHIGSHGFDFDEDAVRTLADEMWERGPQPSHEGVGRQLAAIFKSGDRTRALRHITAPTLVIHGDRDRMVHPSGGLATASAIQGARHETIAGMGHDLPVGAWAQLVALIADHARTAEAAVGTVAG
ncbi:MAG: alpha/beta fold hydrolase [Solirubrobacteraceae bacterium]|nr:alpha/beta fold hydrolase [Solirubrobacteraceae bacterium]